jgi:outer membrane protein assembly factor BamB
VALIELDLTAQPDQTPTSPPPAYRYRLPGLLVAAVLAFALGGAAPALPTMLQFLGTAPTSSPESAYQLTGGRLYTTSGVGRSRETTAWQLEKPLRKLWTTAVPGRVYDPDAVGFGGVQARHVGDVVLLSDGPSTTVLDARTGKLLWTAPEGVGTLGGDRVGVTQTPVFRPGTLYDQDSGDPGLLYFSSTGQPHVEPPLRTDVRGIDLRTGVALWSATLRGAVNVFGAPGDAPAVLVVASDRLERLAGDTGKVTRMVPLPPVGGAGPAGGDVVDGLVLVRYGDYSSPGHEVAYAAGTLDRRWSRTVPDVQMDPPSCGFVLCAGPRGALDVVDPATGRAAWRAPGDVDLMRHGDYVVEVDSGTGTVERLVDPATGALRVAAAGWGAVISVGTDDPIVLRRPAVAGRSVFGVVLPGRDRVQALGEAGGPISDCAADDTYVVCRGTDGPQVWAYHV